MRVDVIKLIEKMRLVLRIGRGKDDNKREIEEDVIEWRDVMRFEKIEKMRNWIDDGENIVNGRRGVLELILGWG